MKFFAVIFVFLLAGSAVAWWIEPDPTPPGKTRLTWVSDDNPARRAHIERFDALHPDLDLHLDPDNSTPEKVIVQSIGGVGPDLFDCYSPNQLSAYVKSGIAWDVTDELAKAGIDVRSETWATIQPYVVYDGRVYGFPANASTDALWFNKDVFDKAGIPYPKGPMTWEQFLPVAQRLTVRDAEGHAKQFGLAFDAWDWKCFMYQWGGRVYSDDGTRCTLDAPQVVAAIQFVHDLIYKYRVAPTPGDEDAMAQAGGWGTGILKFLGSGRVATAIGGRWWLCTLRNYGGLRLGACEQPHGLLREFLGYGKGTLINRNSPHRRQALQFLLYMAGRDYNALVNQQADGLAPVKRFCTDDTLFNPAFPNEDFHDVFRDVMPVSRPDQNSPFANATAVDRIIGTQIDLVRMDRKSAGDAMRTATEQVNEEIAKTLRRDPALAQRYESLTHGATAPPPVGSVATP